MSHVRTDSLGAPRALTDAQARVVWRWDPRPFGDSAPNEDPDGDGQKVVLNLRLPGQYYDPSTGRYISSDPIGLDGGLNTYAYVLNNPLTSIDPLGLRDFDMKISVGGSIGYVIVGGGVYDVRITDIQTGRSTLYKLKAIGLGVGLPSFRGTSRTIRFHVDDPCKTSDSFEGFGYIGGISLEVGAGVKVGGGIKVPNGPFIPGSMIGWDRGGVDIGVPHSITYWSR